MFKTKNKLREVVGATPLGESLPTKDEGRFPASQLKQIKGFPATSVTVDSKTGQNEAVAPASGDQPFSVVRKSQGICFLARPIVDDKSGSLEYETARKADMLTSQRHLNFHHVMRNAFGGWRMISTNAV